MPSSQINLASAHLYACGAQMWAGIEVLDGGLVTADPGNLIEDAKIAINAPNQFTNTAIVINVNNTVFNKNRVDLAVSKHSASPVLITECVFTCRTLTFTANSWPLTGTGLGELRYAFTATTGLSAPYLANTAFPLATLKKPYLNQYSYQAINFADVGVTTGTAFIGATIGSTVSSSLYAYSFNLFDAHGSFLSADRSNVSLKNNVFQNTQRFFVPASGLSMPYFYGGNAIEDNSQLMNSQLNLTSTSYDVGNRFWNCHTAVKAFNVLRFNFTKGIIRSTQSTATITGIQPGNTGLFLATNRFQYEIKDNEFTNINACIHIPIAADAYTSVAQGTVNGIYGHKINIESNTLSAGPSTSNYISHGIRITSPNNSPITYAPDFTISPNTKGIIVQNNTLTSVYRGIYLMGITGFESHVRENLVDLTLDNVFNGTQHGIDLSNTMSANNVPVQFEVSTNTVSGSATTSMEALYYNSLNFGLQSPVIRCNSAANSYQGFVFSGPNTPTTSLVGTQWFGNSMANLNRGMVLTTTAIIGAQGSSLIGCGNMWLGNTWSLTNFNTYTQNSDAASSPLFCAPGNSLNPQYNSGNPLSLSYDNSGSPPTLVSGGGNYSCSDPSARSTTVHSTRDGLSEDIIAIMDCGLYRFLRYSDSIKSADADLNSYYSSLSGSNLEKFTDVEQNINEGDYSTALTTLSGISTIITVEANYLSFYTVYANYLHDLANDDPFSSSDSLTLIDLAMLCPEENGACIYQARSLYENIFAVIPLYPGCANGTGARLAQTSNNIKDVKNRAAGFNIYPNPNDGSFTIESFNLVFSHLKIFDSKGSQVVDKNIVNKGPTLKIQSELFPGLYQLMISTSDGETYLRKIVVTH